MDRLQTCSTTSYLAALLGWQFAMLVTVDARADAVTIVENGRPRAMVVLAADAFGRDATVERGRRQREALEPSAQERLAAEEFQEYVRRISGATLEIVRKASPFRDRLPIYIGSAADPALDDATGKQGEDPCSFALVVGADHVSIRGLSPAGTLNGVYALLEQLGVRWFMPGELGTVIPQMTTVRVEPQTTIQTPAFPARRLQGVRAPKWERRMRLGGPYFPASHGIPGFGRRESERLFQEHPEYFSLIDGERKPRQLCASNPAVLKTAVSATKEYFRSHPEAEIMGIGAKDGRGFCECENCQALDGGDYDPFGHYPSMTDRYIWFFNRVLDGIQDEFPHKRLGFYAYSVYNRPPIKVKPNPRLVPAVALIMLCRLHGMSNPVLMWDPTADVDLLMQDYYEKFFGLAAAPVKQYVDTMSQALGNGDYHTGSSWDLPHIYDDTVRGRARTALDRAARLALKSPYSERVRMYRKPLDYPDAFVEMLASRAEHDSVTSKKALEQMEMIRDQLLANDPPLIGRAAETYLHRFFAKTTLATGKHRRQLATDCHVDAVVVQSGTALLQRTGLVPPVRPDSQCLPPRPWRWLNP